MILKTLSVKNLKDKLTTTVTKKIKIHLINSWKSDNIIFDGISNKLSTPNPKPLTMEMSRKEDEYLFQH